MTVLTPFTEPESDYNFEINQLLNDDEGARLYLEARRAGAHASLEPLNEGWSQLKVSFHGSNSDGATLGEALAALQSFVDNAGW